MVPPGPEAVCGENNVNRTGTKGVATPGLDIVPMLNLLAAIDGVTYLIAPDGEILAFSRGPAPEDDPSVPWDDGAVVGTNLFSAISGDDVRAFYRGLHSRILSHQRPRYGFDYRCDAPDKERSMRMSLSVVRGGGGFIALLYHSILLSETPRVPVPLFSRAQQSVGEPGDPMVTVCSFCQRAAWPAGEPGAWCEGIDFYRLGGPPRCRVSHGICPDCRVRLAAGHD